MKKLIFTVHNHQPVGNFDHVIREAFEKSYKPFIDLVFDLKYPKVCFHFSGILYDWLEKNEPYYLDKIKEMVLRNQIEILSGGYYEPILGVIPERDRISQIKKLNDYINKKFNFSPKGIWLTERVFNPTIPKTLYDCGMEYVVIDDTHLLTSGVEESEVNDCFVTEYEGKKIKIFTINHNLRYLIPYKEPYKTVEYINSFKEGIFVMADDGEKFGLWPESHKLVYEEKWLYNFFETIKNSNIDMVRFMDVSDRKPKKLVYVPNTSYFELSQWALSAEDGNKIEEFRKNAPTDLKKFIRGGFFENFFTKYRQSNLIHKRSCLVSEGVAKNYDSIAENFLHMAQCNCGWWHGVFGGVYLPHIRAAIYENLLKAQKILFDKSRDNIKTDISDIDVDGNEEIIIETKNNFFIFSPYYGGSVTEFSSKNQFVNYSCVMERKKEAYHLKPAKDINGNDINKNFDYFYDWHNRVMLLDHFVNPSNGLADFSKARYGEQGDFIPQPYSYDLKFSNSQAQLSFKRSGVVWDGNKKLDFSIFKKVLIDREKDGLSVKYSIKNDSETDGFVNFVSEFPFFFSSMASAPFKEEKDVREYVFNDPVRGKIKLSFSIPIKLWIIPLETVSNSESGIEKTYQGSVVGVKIDKKFEAKEEFEFLIDLEIV